MIRHTVQISNPNGLTIADLERFIHEFKEVGEVNNVRPHVKRRWFGWGKTVSISVKPILDTHYRRYVEEIEHRRER